MYTGTVYFSSFTCLFTEFISIYCVEADGMEFCQFELFNASCSANQVIVISEARYGRQRIGRCVTRDYGHLGCSANVADLLDQACSGLRWCQFSVSSIRDIVHPCPKDLTAYLEASYRCITRKS